MNSKLRIGYFGDGPWAHEAFEKIAADSSIDIAFVCVRYDYKDPVLLEKAKKRDIPSFAVPSVNASSFLSELETFRCDLLVSMSFNQIFKEKILQVAPEGIINCHAGKLPFYRGRNNLNWVLINDEKEFGITVHYVDTGIDTGDIILQKSYPIRDEDNYQTLLSVAYTKCADLLYDSLVLVKNKQVKRVPQHSIHPVGMYCGRRGPGDEVINWHQTSRELFNFVRAICIPGPRATTFLDGKRVKINRALEIKEAPNFKGFPGQILRKTVNGYWVKTLDSMIEISDVECEGDLKLKVGDRLK